ncbi:MAG: hypothetical protein HQK84_06940 [Nitrospinae bacterium]|nr:hypothetical protein [Nitrospinota bacterium]
MKRLKINLLLLLGTVLFILFCVDMTLRLIGYQTVMPYKIKHTVADMFQMPNRDVDIVLPVQSPEFMPHATTNSIGMLDIEYPEKKPADTLRGIVLGDSFCAALEVPQKDNFHTIMENTMKIHNKKVEFLNFGVRAIGLTQEIQLFNTMAYKYNPDFVLHALYIHNDMVDNSIFYRKAYPDPLIEGSHKHPPLDKQIEYVWRRFNFFLSEKTRVYPFIRVKYAIFEGQFIKWLKANYLHEKKMKVLPKMNKDEKVSGEKVQAEVKVEPKNERGNVFARKPTTSQEKEYVATYMKKYHQFEDKEKSVPDSEKADYHKGLAYSDPLILELLLLNHLNEKLKKEHIKFYVFYFDYKGKLSSMQTVSMDEKIKIYWIIEEFLREKGIPQYNLMAEMAENPTKNLNELFYKTDDHWNVAGHKFVAEKLTPFITQNLLADFK